MEELKSYIKNKLSENKEITLNDTISSSKLSSPECENYIKSFQSKDYITLKTETNESYELTETGNTVLNDGSPEFNLYATINSSSEKSFEKSKLKEISQNPNDFDNALINALSNRLVICSEGKISLNEKLGAIKDYTKELLEEIKEGKKLRNKFDYKKLLKRKFIVLKKNKRIKITKGPKFNLLDSSELVSEILPSYFTTENAAPVKPYNLNSKGLKNRAAGALHPLFRLRSLFRGIFLEMGFEETDTPQFIETSLWNFDALFIPQKHPARDIQDTFYVKDDIVLNNYLHKGINKEEYEKVRKEHEISYKGEWSEKEAKRPLFRTHTTAITAKLIRMVAKRFKEDKNYKGGKYFSIDKVFRNESVDATHLAEFHQIEGIVIGKGISLAHIIGTIDYFFRRIGITQLKYKCAFNPYTEPSMEVFGFSKQLNKLIEIGNSGVFRREMLDPAGIPEDINIIGWGLSLERPAMLMYGVKDIRDLCGDAVDLNLVKDSEHLFL